jgi:hypothetical protein
MDAQAIMLMVSPDRIDDATRFVREELIPELRQMDGYKGFIALADRGSEFHHAKWQGVSLWESRDQGPQGAEFEGHLFHLASATGGSIEHTHTVEGTERYEVALLELSSHP